MTVQINDDDRGRLVYAHHAGRLVGWAAKVKPGRWRLAIGSRVTYVHRRRAALRALRRIRVGGAR